jgi:hypothetical protein
MRKSLEEPLVASIQQEAATTRLAAWVGSLGRHHGPWMAVLLLAELVRCGHEQLVQAATIGCISADCQDPCRSPLNTCHVPPMVIYRLVFSSFRRIWRPMPAKSRSARQQCPGKKFDESWRKHLVRSDGTHLGPACGNRGTEAHRNNRRPSGTYPHPNLCARLLHRVSFRSPGMAGSESRPGTSRSETVLAVP